MTEVSSIDDMLFAGKTQQQPATPEHQPEPEEHPVDAETSFEDSYETDDEPAKQDPGETKEDEQSPEDVKDEVEDNLDDYGNPKEKERTYTEEEVNERINKVMRDRVARFERNNKPDSNQAQQTQDAGFEYNPDSSQDWQQQLEGFVEQTVTKMSSKREQQAQVQREEQAQAEFELKFQNGMSKFQDFRDVVSSQPVTDAMTIATRSMKDPAAFLYAASKRHPQELQRIANMPDQYAQMVEVGKLEERMKKNKPSTKAPRPVSKTRDNASMPVSEKNKTPSIEDLIAHADAKRLERRNARRR
jgi:hypothetical protein